MRIFSLYKDSWPFQGSQALSAKAGLCKRVSQPKITSNSCIDLKIFWVHHNPMKAQGTFSGFYFSEINVEQYAVVILFNVVLRKWIGQIKTEQMNLVSGLPYLCNNQ